MSAKKIVVVAASEFAVAVKSKAFVIGILMLPVFMGGGIAVETLTKDHRDLSDRRFGVADPSGLLFPAFEAAAKRREKSLFDENGKQKEPRFVPVRVAENVEDPVTTSLELELSDRVRSGDLFAFVRVLEDVLDSARPTVRYSSNTPTYRDLPDWIERVVNEEIRSAVVREANLSPDVAAKLDRSVYLESRGLADRTASGEVRSSETVDQFRTFVVPFIALMLLFMTTMSAAPQLLNAVLEEKQLRISEFLVSAVTPFELMAGKLAGTVLVASLLAVLYMGGGIGVAAYYGMIEKIPFDLLPWFLAFLVLAATIYGSVFIAIGAACSDLRDAQSMMSPAMLLVMLPMFTFTVILKEPNGSLATALSIFPLFAPVLMPLRIAVPPGPPWWHPYVALVATILLAACFVWAAGRIFRVGVLMQGKGASFRDMFRWIRAK
jgi:ABC-2 type transport system permease protein